MSPTRSPVQYYSLLKWCFAFFILQAIIILAFFPFIWSVDVTYRVLMLFISIAISLLPGWHLYRQRSHLTFTYDDNGFTLKQGKKNETRRNWSEFSDISLVRTEQGDFSLRLHDDDSFEVPVSALKMNPFQFREEAAKFVEVGKRKSAKPQPSASA